MNKQTIFEGRAFFFHFPEALQWAVIELENYNEAETIPIGIKSSSNEKKRSKEGRQVVWQPIPLHIISPICFHLNCVDSGKGNSSSESHYQNSQAKRGSTLDPELSILSNILSRDLVPLKRKSTYDLFRTLFDSL